MSLGFINKRNRAEMKSRALLAIVVTTATASCRLFDKEKVCTLDLRNGLLVTVKDSVTGAFAASGAKLVVRDGTYADSASRLAGDPQLDALPFGVAAERAGVKRFVFFLAIGATSFQRTRFFRAKALAEQAVAASDGAAGAVTSPVPAPSVPLGFRGGAAAFWP